MAKFIDSIPKWLSSRISIFIYIFLFIYLVLFPAFAVVFSFMKPFVPSNTIQLILGNYTNVLSALGASIAAGSGVIVHRKVVKMQKAHEEMHETIKSLHEKVNEINNVQN